MQARQAHTTARHNRAADPLQRFLPTLLTASGRSGGSLQRVCHRIGRAAPAPRLPASTFPWRKTQHAACAHAACCDARCTALRWPSHRTPFPQPGQPCFCTTVFPHLELRIPGCIKSPSDMQKKPQSETGNHPTPPAQARSSPPNPKFLIATKPILQFKILCSNFPSSAFLNS